MTDIAWDDYFLELAAVISKKSKDPNTKIGCIIVGPEHEVRVTGFNGFPIRVRDKISDRYIKPNKLLYTVHAEANAIALAARNGVSLSGCSIYIHGLYPCANCAGLIIQAGIERVISPPPDFTKATWGEHFRIAEVMFSEAGIKVG